MINGAILRSLNFYRGAIWALSTRNPHVFYDSLRAQCETLALVHYCNEYPSYVVPATIGERTHKNQSLRIMNVTTLLRKANKKYKGLLEDYNSLCDYVHPNPTSLYANIQPITETKKDTLLIHVASKSPRVTEKEAELNLRMLIVWTSLIFKELSALAEYYKKSIERSNYSRAKVIEELKSARMDKCVYVPNRGLKPIAASGYVWIPLPARLSKSLLRPEGRAEKT